MEKKYEILKDNFEEIFGRKVYRIRALKDFGNVKKGDIGGFVESEENLSQDDDCWIYGNAVVCGNTVICDRAIVCYNVVICDNAMVYYVVKVSGDGDVEVSGNDKITPKFLAMPKFMAMPKFLPSRKKDHPQELPHDQAERGDQNMMTRDSNKNNHIKRYAIATVFIAGISVAIYFIAKILFMAML